MSFDWSKYLEFARKQICIDDNGNIIDEAACRTAISRAYYAAFCLSRNYLCKNGDTTLKLAYIGNKDARNIIGPLHWYVINQFDLDSKYEPDKAVIHEQLKALKTLRVFADYKNHHDRKLKSKVLNSIQHAQTIIDTLKKL